MARIEIETLNGSDRFSGYVAEPEGSARGGVIVIQEIFGINEGIRRKCDRWARLGYLAVAPDLFWRMEPGVELDPDVEDELQRAFGLMKAFDQDAGVADIEATIRAMRGRLEPGARVGCVGYCLGGRLAFMAAARTDIDASVGYYGVALENLLDETNAIANPLMLHIAGEDAFAGAEVQATLHEALDDHPRVTLHDYPGEHHGFAAEMGSRRSEEAAREADARTEAFLADHLG